MLSPLLYGKRAGFIRMAQLFTHFDVLVDTHTLLVEDTSRCSTSESGSGAIFVLAYDSELAQKAAPSRLVTIHA